jgi:hypothetical protein
MRLHERIADHLGWTVAQCQSFSLSALREVVTSEKLKHELGCEIRSGGYMLESGYTACACRDCFDTAISEDTRKPELCAECRSAGCEPGGNTECSREDAYGCEEGNTESV